MRVRSGWKRNGYAAPAWAAEQRLGSVGLKATLLVLSTYADEDYTCYPGQERIADETEQSSRQVRRQLEILEEVGLIARTPRYDKGHRITDRFALNLDIAVEAEDVSAAKARVEDRKAARNPLPDIVSGKDSGVHTGHGEQFIPDTGDSSYRTSDVRGTTSRTTSRTSPSLTLAKESPGGHEGGSRAQGEQPALIEAPGPAPESLGRQDVLSLCNHLAHRIEENGSKRPAVSAGWRRAARLLLDTDRRDLTEAHQLIDWCQADTFWRSNILSMPKFREKYDQLRLKANSERPGMNTMGYPEGWY